MNLFDVLMLVVIVAGGAFFWRIRLISETANRYLQQYCNTHQLQLISVARQRTRPMLYKGKLDWHSQFEFEFSSTGQDCYTGTLTMNGLTVTTTHTPAHRIQ